MDDPHRLGPALTFADHAVTATAAPPWRPLTTRIRRETLHARVEQVAHALRSPGGDPVDLRTAASTEHFGLVARLVAAQLCARALGLTVRMTTEDVWWRQPEGGLVQLSLACCDEPHPSHGNAIEELTSTVERLYAVSPHVLWGNVGSAANSTLNLLQIARPDLVADAREAADELLTDPRIDGGGLHAGAGFRRRSCCLIYRTGTDLCGDCVLRR